MNYAEYLRHVNEALTSLQVTDSSGRPLDSELGFKKWCEWTAKWAEEKRNLFFIGNGASSAMASHMSADAAKNGRLRARCLNDPSLLTAIGNDLSYDQSFALQLDRYADRDDVLITISSSGNSPNIIAALQQAKKMGMTTVSLSGMKPDNRSRTHGDLNFYLPAARYGFVECGHQVLLHCWLDQYLKTLGIEM